MNNQAPLHYANILITRPLPKAISLCEQVEAHGGQAILFPTIAFEAPSDQAALAAAIPLLREQTWLIFMSPQAVYSGVPLIRQAWPHLPATVQFAAVGSGTARALQEAGHVGAVFPKDDWRSESLLQLPAFQSVSGTKIALIRGEGGRDWVGQTLTSRGAKVLDVIVYQRVLPVSEADGVRQRLMQQKIDAIVCTSFEGVKNLKRLMGEAVWPYLKQTPLVVVSERIKILAVDLGFQTIWVAKNATDQSIIDVLARHEDMT